MTKLNSSLSVVVTSLLLGGCVTASAPIANGAVDSTVRGVITVKDSMVTDSGDAYQGAPAFDGVALTARRDDAVLMATEQYGVEPVCDSKKVAPRNSRRADFYERCEFAPVSKAYGKAEITSVTYHFMSSRLVQIDATLAGAAVAMQPTAESLDAILGTSDFSSTDVGGESDGAESLPQAIYHWTKSSSLAYARLQTAAAADDEAFQLSIQHPMVTDVIAELPALGAIKRLP